jgi:chitin disaccharide deacetylase
VSANPSPRPARLLVVTADDFGIGLETSRGIVDTARDGPVTATSALVVTDACEASLPLLDEVPGLELGLHIALTGRFRPLVATRASGFVGRDGRFGDVAGLLLSCLARRVSRAALRDEIAAQVERLQRLARRPAVHFDGHHHVHELPLVREVVAELSQEGVLPPLTRVSTEPTGVWRLVPGERFQRRVIHWLGRRAKPIFAAHGLWTNDTAFGRPLPAGAGGFPWVAHLRSLPKEGVVEWIVHPGRPDPTLRGVDPYVEGRVTEWRALTAPEHRAQWQQLPWPRAGKSPLRLRGG